MSKWLGDQSMLQKGRTGSFDLPRTLPKITFLLALIHVFLGPNWTLCESKNKAHILQSAATGQIAVEQAGATGLQQANKYNTMPKEKIIHEKSTARSAKGSNSYADGGPIVRPRRMMRVGSEGAQRNSNSRILAAPTDLTSAESTYSLNGNQSRLKEAMNL